MKQLILFRALLLLFLAVSASGLFAQTETATITGSRVAGGLLFDAGNAVTFDKQGFLYTAGQFSGTITLGTNTFTSVGATDVFVMKSAPNGSVLWAVQIGGTDLDRPTGIALDSHGKVYVSGLFLSPALEADMLIMTNRTPGTLDAFLYKLDGTSGAVLWSKNPGGDGNDAANDVYVDKFNQIYLTGYFEQTADFDGNPLNSVGGRDAFLARYDSLGTTIWAEQSGGNRTDYGSQVVTDSVGTVYMTGSFASDTLTAAFFKEANREKNGTYDVFVTAYDSLRIPVWLFTGGGFDDDFGNAITIDSLSNELYIAGMYTNLALFGGQSVVNDVITGKSLFILKLDDASNVLWVTKGDGDRAEPADIALDKDFNVVTVGKFSESLNFGCTGVTEWFESYGKVTSDAFVTKHNANGQFLSVGRFGARSKPDEARSAALNPLNNRMLVTGYFTDTVAFGTDIRISAGTQDIFWTAVGFQTSACGPETRRSFVSKKILPACEISNDTIFATGFTGRVIRWEVSVNNGGAFTPIEHTEPFYVIGKVPANNAVYRAVIQSCDCQTINSDTVRTSVVFVPSNGGKITGGGTFCILGNAGILRLNGQTGLVLRWESSLDRRFQAGITPIASTLPQIPFSNVTVATYYRAVVKNGICLEAFSDTALVTADSCEFCNHPRTVAGTTSLFSSLNPACIDGNTPVTVRLTGNTGIVTRWELSEDGFATFVAFPGGQNTFPLPGITKKTWVRAQVKNLTCFPEVSTATIIDVDSCEACGFVPSLAGSLAAFPQDSFCVASGNGELRLSGHTGEVMYWEFATTLGGPYFRIRNTTDLLLFQNPTQSRWYRAVIRSPRCKPDTTEPLFVKVYRCTPCPVPTSFAVTRTTHNTASVTWRPLQRGIRYVVQYRPLGASFWVDENVENPPLLLTGLTPNQTYQVRVRTVCSDGNSSLNSTIQTFVTSCSEPGFLSSSATTVCKGNNSFTLRVNNPVGEVLRWEYSTDNFRRVSAFNRSSINLTINNLAQTTSYRAVVRNLTCNAVASEPFTVEVRDCAPACPVPLNLIVRNIKPASAEALWAIRPGVSDFELSYRAEGNTEWITVAGLSDQTFMMRNLIPNSEYSVRLRNICDDGSFSNYGDTVKFRTPDAPGVCPVPTSVSFVPSLTETQVNITPVPGAAEGYEITYVPIVRPTSVTISAPMESIRLRNLIPDTEYRVRIKTNCSNGLSLPSAEFTFRTLPVNCTAPLNLRAAPLTSTTVRLNWDVVLQAPGYTVRVRPPGTAVWSTQRVNTNTVDVTGLRPGTTYETQVQANCVVFTNSPYSPVIRFSLPTLRTGSALAEEKENISVYPNPTTGILNLNLPLTEEAVSVRVTDLTGKTIYETQTEQTEITVDLSGQSAGLYLLSVTAGSERKVLKIVKE